MGPPERYARILASLTRAQSKAWSLIARYARTTGRRCLTYNTLMRWWRENPDIPIRPQTLDRRVRELVELGLLERVEKREGRRRVTLFCLPNEIYEWLTSTWKDPGTARRAA